MARPRKPVDENTVQRLAGIGCTVAEIAAVTGVDKRTLERGYAASIEKGRERGKRSLRRMQWKAAKTGNVTMMIWLGKQLLAQADRQEVTGKDGGPIQTAHETRHTVDYDAIEAELRAIGGRVAVRATPHR
jgi:hypothetical protein